MFEVYDGNGAVCKVYVLDFQSQGLADSAAEPKKKADQDFIPQIGRRLLQHSHFL